MSKTKQALELAVAALRDAREDVEEVARNCAAALAGTEKGARRVEAYRQQLAEIDAAIRDAEAALAQPKPEPEPEPVAWQHRRPLCGSDGYEIGYGDWEDGYGLEQWPHRALYAGAAPTQSADLAAVTAACREHARTSGALVNKLYNYSPNLSDSVAAGQWMQTAAQLLTMRVPDATQSAELAAVTAERDQLRAWKQSQLAVETDWNPQVIANLLEIGLGQSIRAGIRPAVLQIISERDKLRAEVDRLRAERVPLTDEQIVSAIRACEPEDANDAGWIWRTRIKWARAVERAHGITSAASTTQSADAPATRPAAPPGQQ